MADVRHASRRITLLVCAAGKGVQVGTLPPLLVCGRLPGHDGKHRDAVWPVEWDGTAGRVSPGAPGWTPPLPVGDMDPVRYAGAAMPP
jgi:hypothetical protein